MRLRDAGTKNASMGVRIFRIFRLNLTFCNNKPNICQYG